MFRCTGTHLILDAKGDYVEAANIQAGQQLSGGHTVIRAEMLELPERIPVYDMSVPHRLNFVLENGIIAHNSGKSFSAKREISNAFLSPGRSPYPCPRSKTSCAGRESVRQ